MLDKQEKATRNRMLALSGGFLVATLVFILFYQLLGFLIHDKPMSFLLSLFLSFYSLIFVRSELIQVLKD